MISQSEEGERGERSIGIRGNLIKKGCSVGLREGTPSVFEFGMEIDLRKRSIRIRRTEE